MEVENYTIDAGCLAVYDGTPLDPTSTASPSEDLRSRAWKAYQLLLEQVRKSKLEEEEDNALKRLEHRVIDFEANPHEVTLPPPTIPLPRFLRLSPTPTLTRWEQFARTKGIQKKKKRSRLVWNEETKDWVPRWGRNSSKHIQEDLDIIREVG